MKKRYLVCSIFGLSVSLFSSSSLYAGLGSYLPPTVAPNKSTQTHAYAGLVWTLNNQLSYVPDISLGVRSLAVKSDNHVSGAEANLRVNLKDAPSLNSVRLLYVGGNRDLQGNIGVGYSFLHKDFLATLAGSAPYSKLGVDYLFREKSFQSYLEVNSLAKPHVVNDTLNCDAGFHLVVPNQGDYEGVSGENIVNGMTCANF